MKSPYMLRKCHGRATPSAVNLLTRWNPASHIEYWQDNDVTHPLAESLARLWRQTNSR